MPVYSYKAQNSFGQTLKGTYSANNNNEVYKMLRDQGYYPLDIAESSSLTAIKSKANYKAKKLSLKDLVMFCKQIAAVIKAGVPVLRAIDLLRKQTKSRNSKVILDNLYDGIQKGFPLSETMKSQKDVFPSILISMIEAGESTGNLEGAFDRMANHFEKEMKITQKVKKAMTYPVIMIIVCIIAVTVLLVVVLPKFAAIFADAGMKLPVTTRILIGVANFLTHYWYLLVPIVIGLVIGFIQFQKTPFGRRFLHDKYLKIPIISTLIQNAASEKFCRTVSAMVSAGVSLINALDHVQKVVGNALIEEGLVKVREDVSNGRLLSESIAKVEQFPVMVSQMIQVGEESGSLDGMLEKTADYYENEVDTTITILTTVLEPTVLFVMAIIIGFIVISILQPMFDLGKAFG